MNKTAQTMLAAIPLLADLKPSFEHPGYIDITVDPWHFAFGDANDDFMGDYGDSAEPYADRYGCLGVLTRDASPEQLAEFIRKQIAIVITDDQS